MNVRINNFLVRAKNYPPPLCRMLARRKGGRGLSQVEIADTSKLPLAMVEAVTFSMTWNEVPLGTMTAFLKGCNMDFTDWSACHRMDEYIRSKPQFEHLIRSPQYATYWLPLMIRWRKSVGVAGPEWWPPVRALLVRLTPLIK